MHVVSARVAHTRDRGAVRDVLLVGDRERVDVGPQRDSAYARAGLPVGNRAGVDRAAAGADLLGARNIAPDAGAGGEDLRLQPTGAEPVEQHARRPDLGTAELGMRVQVSP